MHETHRTDDAPGPAPSAEAGVTSPPLTLPGTASNEPEGDAPSADPSRRGIGGRRLRREARVGLAALLSCLILVSLLVARKLRRPAGPERAAATARGTSGTDRTRGNDGPPTDPKETDRTPRSTLAGNEPPKGRQTPTRIPPMTIRGPAGTGMPPQVPPLPPEGEDEGPELAEDDPGLLVPSLAVDAPEPPTQETEVGIVPDPVAHGAAIPPLDGASGDETDGDAGIVPAPATAELIAQDEPPDLEPDGEAEATVGDLSPPAPPTSPREDPIGMEPAPFVPPARDGGEHSGEPSVPEQGPGSIVADGGGSQASGSRPEGGGNLVPLPNLGRAAIVGGPAPDDARATPAVAEAPIRSPRPAADAPMEVVPHVVQRQENFWTISRLYYGSGRFWKALWKANADQIPAADQLYVGATIRVPPPEALDRSLVAGATAPDGGSPTPSGPSRPAEAGASRPESLVMLPVGAPARSERTLEPPPEPATVSLYHVVRERETLRTIARDTLGDSRREDEIRQLNLDVVGPSGPLRIGSRLRLPEDAHSIRVRR